MSIDRKKFVIAFQACTGIEDVLLAILYLEDAEWDLSAAIRRMVLPKYKQPPIITKIIPPPPPKPIDPKRIYKYKAVKLKPIRSRYLTFNVKFEDRIIKFKLPETANFSNIKHRLSRELNIPGSRQNLTFQCKTGVHQNVPFSYLFLSSEVDLILRVNTPLQTNA